MCIRDRVKAALPGKVIKSETTKDQATVVILDHGDGWLSSYAHLGKSSVRVGQTLKAGQTIGTVGEPGLSEVSDAVSYTHLDVYKRQHLNTHLRTVKEPLFYRLLYWPWYQE